MNLNINIAHSDIKDQSDRLIDNVNMYDELLRMTTAPNGSQRSVSELF